MQMFYIHGIPGQPASFDKMCNKTTTHFGGYGIWQCNVMNEPEEITAGNLYIVLLFKSLGSE